VSAQIEHAVALPIRATLFNFGGGLREVAKVALNTDYSWVRTHDVAIFDTAGTDPAPLAFYGHAQNLTGVLSGTVPVFDDMILGLTGYLAVEALSRYRGYVVLRRPGEDVIGADVSVTFARNPAPRAFIDTSIAWRQVRTHGLVV
jgi:hypothetical protein